MALEVVELLTTLKSDITGFVTGFQQAQEKSEGLVSTIKNHSIAIGASMATLGGLMEHFADPIEKSKATLEAVLKNNGSSFEELGGKIDDTVKHMENFGHGAADTQNALAALTTKLGDPNAALKDMSTVAELAAFKHESLTEAAGQLGKALDGNTRILKQFGVVLENVGQLQKDADKATKLQTDDQAKLATAQQALTDLQARLAAATQAAQD